ncbi:MAG: acyl--CoA ligase [Succinivibrio sp.]|nr:acyl--CoA ligase [Succinivibrio sp.]
MIPVAGQILRQADRQPDKTALTDGRITLTYAQLRSAILINVQRLKSLNVGYGDRVMIVADRQPGFVPLYLACHLSGAVTVPLPADIAPSRYAFIKKKVNPRLIIGFTDPDISTLALSAFASGDEAEVKAEPTSCDCPELPDLSDLAEILFTTGTTGEPKGVLLSQQNLAASVRNIGEFIGNTTDDIELLVLPLSHSFGLNRLRCALSNGQTLVLSGGLGNVKRLFRLMQEFQVTGLGLVPSGWAMLHHLSGDKIAQFKDQLRYLELGSSAMELADKQELMRLLPHTRICMHYGLTEASRSAFIEFHTEKAFLDTAGRPSPHTQITIRDEQGTVLPCDTLGEICVEGESVTSGYLDLPREGSFWGRAFRTGDLGRLDAQGYLTFYSRKKELINVGGEKVSPLEVEEVLRSLDFVQDCACVPTPDPRGILSEVVKAFIVTDRPELITFESIDPLIGNRLEGYKHPALYAVTDKIPRTSSGKIQRRLLT